MLLRLPVPIAALCAIVLSGSPWASAAPSVVATIAPLHGLAASVTDGVSAPGLLLRGSATPHGFTLRPSQARLVSRADVVLWIGPSLEASLDKLLKEQGSERLLTVSALESIETLPAKRTDHAHGHGHDPQGAIDPHLWLSPHNARIVVRALARRLAAIDPANAGRYRANAEHASSRIAQLDRDLANALAPVRERPYVVFHDAYRYFEQHYRLRHAGALAIDPQRPPGARRVASLRDRIRTLGAGCVFTEPQFEPRLVRVLAEGTGARVATLDPLGSTIAPGPDAWFALMRALAGSLLTCLSD